MNMVSFKNKLQSSEISVGLNSNKSQNNLDDLFAELFALVNLGDDSSEKLISPKNSEMINLQITMIILRKSGQRDT